MGIGRCSKTAVEVPSTDFCRCRTLSTALLHVFAWLWAGQDSDVLLVSCSLSIPPLCFVSKIWIGQDVGRDVQAPAAVALPCQAVFQPHTAPGFVSGLAAPTGTE